MKIRYVQAKCSIVYRQKRRLVLSISVFWFASRVREPLLAPWLCPSQPCTNNGPIFSYSTHRPRDVEKAERKQFSSLLPVHQEVFEACESRGGSW
jgi:hypothetical protein